MTFHSLARTRSVSEIHAVVVSKGFMRGFGRPAELMGIMRFFFHAFTIHFRTDFILDIILERRPSVACSLEGRVCMRFHLQAGS